MKRLIKFALVITVISASFTACKKGSESTPSLALPSTSGFNTIRTQALSDITISKSFKAENGLTFQTAKGTKIEILPNCLRDNSSQLVTGDVTLSFVEIYDRGNMVMTNKPVMGRNSAGDRLPLITGGQFNIQVSQGNQNLNSGCPFFVTIPAALTGQIDNAMKLWEGNIGEDGNLVWDEIPGGVGGQNKRAGMTINSETATYSIWSNEFGWTNVDRFINEPDPKAQIKVTVPTGYNHSNSAVYLAYENEPNLLAQLDVYETADHYFTEHYGFLPVGKKVNVIFTSESNGAIVYAIKKVTIATNGTIGFASSELNTTSKSNLVNIINSLN